LQPGARVPLVFLFANSDASPARLGGQILDDFAARHPKFVVLPADSEKLIDLYRNHMIEMVRYPARADAFAKAIRKIDQYVRSNYSPAASLNGMIVWERSSTTATDATARVANSD